MILYSHATKTHSHKKGFAFRSPVLKKIGIFWNSELAH